MTFWSATNILLFDSFDMKCSVSLKFGNYNFTALKKQKIQVRCVPLSVILYIKMKEVGKSTTFRSNSEKLVEVSSLPSSFPML